MAEDSKDDGNERKCTRVSRGLWQIVKLLVQSITVGKKREDGRIEVRITYRFGPPSAPPGEAGGGELSVAGLKNGSRS